MGRGWHFPEVGLGAATLGKRFNAAARALIVTVLRLVATVFLTVHVHVMLWKKRQEVWAGLLSTAYPGRCIVSTVANIAAQLPILSDTNASIFDFFAYTWSEILTRYGSWSSRHLFTCTVHAANGNTDQGEEPPTFKNCLMKREMPQLQAVMIA